MQPSVQPARSDLPPEAIAELLWGTDPKLNGYMFRTMPTLYKILAAEWPAHFDASLLVQAENLSTTEADHLHAAIYWMDRLFPTPRENSYYVLELAVSEAAQGEGLAKLLLTAGLERARDTGCTSICLDVAADNDAVSFYQHLGFETEIETRVPYLAQMQSIGLHYHMVRGLEPWA